MIFHKSSMFDHFWASPWLWKPTFLCAMDGLKLEYLPFGRWPAPKNPQIGGINPGVGRPVVPFLLHSKTRKLHSFVVYATHIFFWVFFLGWPAPKCHTKSHWTFCESSKKSLFSHWWSILKMTSVQRVFTWLDPISHSAKLGGDVEFHGRLVALSKTSRG